MSLAHLMTLAEVPQAMALSRKAVDDALGHRALRRSGGVLAREVGLASAVASAALEGHVHDLADVRDGTVTDPVLQGALRVSAALDSLAPRWLTAPRQALARLHLLAATGCPGVGQDDLGRPNSDPATAARLDALFEVVLNKGTEGTLLRAAVVHGELLALGAFAGPNGVVARGAARLTLIAAGLDPRGLIAPEIGHLSREAEYLGCANAFATGTPDGVRAWLKHCAGAVTLAAAELARLAQTQ